MNVKEVVTTPFSGQKPGTSGLRKPVMTFFQENYTENFIQSTFNAIGDTLFGRTLIVGGDGRFFMSEAAKIIIQMAAANKVGKVIIGVNGILSTPAVSCLIRKRKAIGGIILTASHNPGGKDGDFGIKYNISNGGPAPESVTNEIYNHTTSIAKYQICEEINMDISKPGYSNFQIDGKNFYVEVVSSVNDYVALMKDIFDFKKLKEFVSNGNIKLIANGMNGVTGPYLKRIICEELGAPESSIMNAVPLEDFGGAHPDPNMTYAADFVNLMKVGEHHVGAAFDGDGDRNMILGENAFFVNPSDSVAIIAAHADCIPYFKKSGGLKGLARSMPTSAALDRVADKLNIKKFEVPTGWKYFGNLMDDNQLSICGEESFGTGSDHIREKDGIWALLAWLSILASTERTVQQVIEDHWMEYGRNFFTRYDYENVDSVPANQMMSNLRNYACSNEMKGQQIGEYIIDDMDDFKYVDPVDKSLTEKQGVRLMFTDGSRIVYRLSGTGSSGATIRIYVETYITDRNKVRDDPQVVLKPLVEIALHISKLTSLTGRNQPTVIT